MMKKIMAILFVGIFLFAAEYGRIIGRVVDTETNEPLTGADVIVEGTDLGAATDENGEFVVLYVPAGSYTIVASYISYDPLTYTGVVVNSDQTTELNFRLRPTIIEVEGVVTTAERPMVVLSKVSTDRAVTSDEMDRLPVTTINQVITLQAGVVESDLGTHLRGGRTDEITYFVDGIITKVPNFGWQSIQVSPTAVEEVTIVSGGFDAEYGDALSGVVNIVTKEGGTRVSGNFNYLTDEIFSGEKMNYGYNLYDLSLGGPIPMVSRLRYFLSGEMMLTDAYQEARYRVPAPRMDYRGQARLSYFFPNAKGKVTFSGHAERRQYVYWMPSLTRDRSDYKYLDNKPMTRIKNLIGSATFNYMLTAQTLASLKVGATKFERCYGNRDYEWEEENDRAWYDDYRLKAEHLISYLLDEGYQEEHGITVTDILIDSLMQYHEEYTTRGVYALRNSPYGVEGLFYTYGDYRVWRYWRNYDYQARFDVTHSVGKVHEFKTGIDFTKYDMRYYDNNLPWVTNPFWDAYHRTPYKAALYVQDKMDFEGLIARLGVRFDYFDPKTFSFSVPNDFQDTSLVYADKTYKISPRLGFSLPITDRMKLRFNYGHYFQLPTLDDMYTTVDTAVVRVALTRGNTIIGNIDMEAQKTVMYEFGIENQFSENIAFAFTAYFKDIYDLSAIREVPALPMAYFQYFNVDYGNVKGFEFNLTKRMSEMWALGLTYTLQFAKGTSSYAFQFYENYYYTGLDPITGLPYQAPVIDYWLDFDERHIVNANLDLEFPKDFFLIPLQDFVSSFVFSYHSGHPYTPEDLKGNKLGDENSARMPAYWNVNMSASRTIGLGPVNIKLSALIDNLFNTEQVVDVYSTTGDPNDHGDPEPSLGQFGYISITSDRYSPQADYNHDGIITPVEYKREYMVALADYYEDPTNYNGPFRVQLGVGIGF
jgi:outer membrane receptor protein involved in Fe transport